MIHRLTVKEQIVYDLLMDGFSNKEIARMLNVNIPTIKGRMAQILKKTGASTRLRLVVAHYKGELR